MALLIKRVEGPFAVVYGCPFCKMAIVNKKPTDWGKAGKAKGEIVRHIRAAHPEKVPT